MDVHRKVIDARRILTELGLPTAQRNEMAALTLLALCGLGPTDPWTMAERRSRTVTKGIMAFIAQYYDKPYAPNTRETFRRQVLHQFVQARIADYNPDSPDLPTNSPRAHYAISAEALNVIRQFDTPIWQSAADQFVSEQGSLHEAYEGRRQMRMLPLTLPDGRTLTLSPGKHNELQISIVEEFGPRFAPGARLLYVGDTANKDLYVDDQMLGELGIHITEHSKLPDVVLYDGDRNWLLLVEAVTSHGPMTPKRVMELRQLLCDCPAGMVFVSAFLDSAEFRKHFRDISWETEVWLAETPEHMIHLNGDRFLGPR